MGLLDRDAHPMRFGVVTSVVSGLTVAVILGLTGAITRTGLLTLRVPLWLLILPAVLCACLVTVLLLQRKEGVRQAFLVVHAFSETHWVSELTHNIHKSLDRGGIEMILKVPDKDFSDTDQARHLRGILSRRNRYVGGLIVPVEFERRRNDLLGFCAKFAKPVVLMDIEPFDDESEYPPNTSFVGYDSALIGKRAADWVVDRLSVMGEADPVVMIIGARGQRRRQQRFVEVIKEKMPNARVILDEDGEFARMRARRIVARHVRELRDKGCKPSMIFCTNDEMALGAADALIAEGTTTATVVGVDGTPEAKAHINAGQGPLRATIIQDSHRVSEIAVDLLERMLRSERVPVRTLLAGELYLGSS